MASLTSDQVTGGLVGRSLGVSHVPGIDQRVPPIGAEFQSFSRLEYFKDFMVLLQIFAIRGNKKKKTIALTVLEIKTRSKLRR